MISLGGSKYSAGAWAWLTDAIKRVIPVMMICADGSGAVIGKNWRMNSLQALAGDDSVKHFV